MTQKFVYILLKRWGRFREKEFNSKICHFVLKISFQTTFNKATPSKTYDYSTECYNGRSYCNNLTSHSVTSVIYRLLFGSLLSPH